ncbi:RE1-silencing transcription factor-like [Ostrea edulis]|uniref:RE1-silencing transcription factor-like n=1 Tax=Ostrea edulis TaxID=37623 RepID=UPI002095A84C|nr:RE1-silencing transcription factor-like [Ostrea edulis]
MAKTKVTPANCRRCPMCTFVARSGEEYKSHVLQCAMRTFNCTYCTYSSNKEINVKRHERRSHPGLIEEPIKLDGKPDKSKESTSSKSVEEEAEKPEEEWLKQDYGDIIGCVSSDSSDNEGESHESQPKKDEPSTNEDLLEGRVIRKQTAPSRPFVPKVKIPPPTGNPEMENKQDTRCESCKRKLSMVDIGIQTEACQKSISSKRIKRFREGDIDIEEIVEEKTEFC